MTEVRTPGDGLRRIRACALGLLLTLAVIGVTLPLVMSRIRASYPTPILFYRQDLVVLPLVCLAIMFCVPGRPLRSWRPATHGRCGAWLALAAAALFGLCCWGHRGVFWGIDFSRDEQMAVFDAAVFRSGHLAAAIPAAWRGIAPALNLLFILPIGDHAAWVSSYLPVNAALRALVATVADPTVTSPLLVVVGLLALAAIGRRLWPDSPGSRWAAVLCYLSSSQIVIMGMTAYAMSAHLAFNCVWLLLFLRGDRIGLVGTLVVGLVATGVHQPLFHPLFALPFVIDLARQRRWRRLGVYGVGYALICGFWLAWPVWISGLAGAVPTGNAPEGIDYATRLGLIVAQIGGDAVWTMAVNLIRFVTWQHLLLLPLLLLGIASGWRARPSEEPALVRPLAIGLVLPILVMGILLPWQGHGWGYRYLHQVLGNACLLAGYGWRRAEAAGYDLRRIMGLTTGLSLLLLLPFHGWMVRTMVGSQAAPELAIRRLSADVAIIDTAPFGTDLVINAPDLGNRPIRLLGAALRPADIARLCRGRRIAFVDAPRIDGLNVFYTGDHVTRASNHQHALRDAARQASCRVTAG